MNAYSSMIIGFQRHAIRQGNAQLWAAIGLYRITRDAGDKSAVYDALNARHLARNWKPTPAMVAAVSALHWLRDEAPDLYRAELHRIYSKGAR